MNVFQYRCIFFPCSHWRQRNGCLRSVLAGSINIHPLLVRKELGNLRAYGLVVSKDGKAGGSKLARSAASISMSEIYDAVRQNDLLGKSIHAPNPACNVGRQINDYLGELYTETELALMASLGKKSLADFCENFKSEHTKH